jgi:peptide/nickel transport system permease protein
MDQLFHGNLGIAWHTGQPVTSDLLSRLPASLELALFGLGVGIPLGILAGVVSARHQDKVVDHVVRFGALGGLAVPDFLVSLLSVYIFFYLFNLAPAPLGRLGITMQPPPHVTGLYTVDSVIAGDWVTFGSALAHLALPALTLAFVVGGVFVRFMRASMLEILSSDAVASARGRGIPERTIIYKYALKQALLPVLSVFGVVSGQAIGGLVVIETIFTWPGLGRYAINSFQVADYSAVQGFVLLSTVVYLVINLIVDILQAVVDPRVAY